MELEKVLARGLQLLGTSKHLLANLGGSRSPDTAANTLG